MKVLAAIDFSAVTGSVLATLERMAGTFPVEVWLVHVSPPDPAFVGYATGPDVVRSQVATEHRQRHIELQQLADRLRAKQINATALLLQGPTVETIVADAKRLGAELIVLGSHGHGAVYNMLVGSVAEGIVRASPVPVLLVPARR